MKEDIRKTLLEAGASAVGFAKAGEIDSEIHKKYKEWIESGNHGEMTYLERHLPLRLHTDNVLPGAKTVISLAFSYFPIEWRSSQLPVIAAYAYSDDYHIRLREILKPLVLEFRKRYGGNWRICIDSAPVAERYWALKSGVGKRGLNGTVIVEGCGSACFLAEVFTTVKMEPDTHVIEDCQQCGKCIKSCPGKAFNGDGTLDARRCISYLTIEKDGDFSEEEKKLLTQDKGYLFGCDLCIRVCPHNSNITQDLKPLREVDKNIIDLLPNEIIKMEEKEFQQIFSRSPLLYAGYSRLRRNAQIKIAAGNS